jgi:SAM-dependent methyltransferase
LTVAATDEERAQWDDGEARLRIWYATGLGAELHAEVRQRAARLLRGVYGLHCLQAGSTHCGDDFLTLRTLVHALRIQTGARNDIPPSLFALPFASESIDLVVLCHRLEFQAEPWPLLREVERVLARDGHLLVICFNPWSLFGLRRLWRRNESLPWTGRFYSGARIAEWCAVLGMRTLRRESCWLRPPVHYPRLRRWLRFVESAEALFPHAGGVLLLLARKQSIPLNPIRATGALRRRRTIPGVAQPTARDIASTSWRERHEQQTGDHSH